MAAQQPVQQMPVNPKPAPATVNSPKIPKTASEPHPVISILGITLITLAIFAGGYLYLEYLQNQHIKQAANTAAQKQKEEADLVSLRENSKNDQTRRLDLVNLKQGLDGYYKKYKKYPKSFEDLTPTYLTVIPLDPVTKATYDYTPSKDFSSYSLSALLSDGSVYKISG